MQLVYEPFIEICAFGFLLMITIFFFVKEKLFTTQSVFYAVFLVITLLSLALDVATAYTISYSRYILLTTNMVLNTLLFTSTLLSSVVFFLFVIALSGGIWKLQRMKVLFVILLLPFVAGIASIIVNYRTGIIFYFDRYRIYHHGPYYFKYCMLGLFYIFSGIFYTIYNRRHIPRAQIVTIFLYALLSAAAIVFQYYFPRYLMAGAFEALGLLCMYFTFQNPDTYIDGLTGIFGRSAFLVVVGQHLRWHNDSNRIITVDINSFKTINNHFGFVVGDNLIKSVVEFLQTVVTNKRSLFRIGGDQFALILSEEDSEKCVEQIRRRFKYSWSVMDNKLQLSASIAEIPAASNLFSRELLMQIIENSLLIAKESGIGSYVFVDSGIVASIKRKIKLESCLHNFEKNNCLKLFFQPIYGVRKKRIVCAEALLRMFDPELGEIPPDEFIHVAERLGLANRIGRFILKETCRFVYDNKPEKLGLESIALNLSAAECMQENYAEYIKEVLTGYPFDKSILAFEISETLAATARSRVAGIMDTLRPLGVKFSLDDYSQGYSNIQAIISLPFNAIKTDKELLWNALKSEKANTIYRHTVKMFKEMGLKVIGEGAETEQHVKFLLEHDIDYIQGFYFGKALSKEDFLDKVLKANAGSAAR